ncbi:hypothetical protein AMTRI_Chr09g17760 [Amborella trichopoda]
MIVKCQNTLKKTRVMYCWAGVFLSLAKFLWFLPIIGCSFSFSSFFHFLVQDSGLHNPPSLSIVLNWKHFNKAVHSLSAH